ncbi:hypothetical protein KK159_08700 [Bacillus velezensis]|nr:MULTISPECIES: hypothetical protein [Bacillus]OAL84080.1 hypothetical protein AY609_11145 [Bacillus velezensis]QWQ29546.1 hypothetical protein JNUCC22_06090 [Bacillus sp. JNUCC-22]
MIDVFKLVGIPILASAFTILFTTGITLIKEVWQEKRSHVQLLEKDKLKLLYNKLYIIKLKVYDSLDLADIFRKNNEPLREPNSSAWDFAIDLVKPLIEENIHLLEADDLHIWGLFLEGEGAEIYFEEAYYLKYKHFLVFLDSTSKTYLKLYRKYHKIT